MNRLTALLYLQDPQEPTAKSVRDDANKTFAAMISNHESLNGILEAQADLYIALREDDCKDTEVETGAKAEEIFRAAAFRGFREHFPAATSDSESYTWWPDGMNVNRPWPVSMLKDFGYLAGFRDGIVAKEMRKYAEAHQAK